MRWRSLKDIKISDMKRNFCRCSICVKGEAAVLRSLKNRDPERYLREKHERKVHLMQVNVN